MFTFSFEDKIKFTKAVYYHFHKIPLPKPFKDGTGGMGKFAPEQGCIELYDQEGACAHLSVGPGFITDILPMILNGEEHSYNEWRNSLYWKIRNAGFQSEKAVEVGQLDLMMLDILAQRANKPLHRFMGATKDWAQAYKGGGSLLMEDDELVEDMVRYVEEGYTTVKFKVGSNDGTDMERDLRRIEKVRKAVGDKIGVAVDCNQRWDVDSAYKFAKLCEPYHLAWLEEPIHSHNMNGIRRLKEMGVKIPIAFGESMRIYYEYETYIFKNKSFGYSEDEWIEYHEPISRPVGAYTLFQPEEKNGRFYCQPDLPGNPQRLDIAKLEKDGLMESREIYYPKNW